MVTIEGMANSRKIAIVLSMVLAAAAEEKVGVMLPEGYRGWMHVKSVVAVEGGKIFQFYANPAAIEGYRTGKFPNGAIIVRETIRTVAGEGESKGTLTEGDRSGLDVMVKDEANYKDTGGWGFESFDLKNGAASGNSAQCYGCHAKQKEHDLVFSTLPATGDAGTPFPEGYRRWTFLHSSMVPPAFDAFAKKPCEKPCMAGLFHFYANDLAMVGLRTGSYPDGSIIAEEMLEWISTSGGGAKEGPRRVIGVMVKDSRRYGSTDGWGYGNFDDGSKVDKLDAKKREACHQCHISRKAQGYVFTEYRDR